MAGERPPESEAPGLLALGALGVVFGDIGTSPLYTLRACFHSAYSVASTRPNVMGVLSLVAWSLILVVSVKYLAFVLRAHNRGEGGILALTSLLHPGRGNRSHLPAGRLRRTLTLCGLLGTGLLYADGMITPAISVLSAVEGLEVATPVFEPFVLPITVATLAALFLVQRQGTRRVAAVFGPIMLVWFATLAALGAASILRHPEVLAAIDPAHAFEFFRRNRLHGFFVLGSVVLVVTGAEALYQDLGHFGARPIRLGWFAVALPALMLNYFGQGALLLVRPDAADNPFFRLAPAWALYPVVALATAATVIASQAVISGAYSLSMQAVQLGFAPRLQVTYTSAREMGQIYMPQINWILMVAAIALVLGFGSSTDLAAAYGVSISSAMVITSVIFYFVACTIWGWRALTAGTLSALFLVVDLAFCSATMVKVADGGWFALGVAIAVFTLLSTWWTGRRILSARIAEESVPLAAFIADPARRHIHRVPGTAVFLTGNPRGVPPALLHNVKHNQVIHETVVLVTVVTAEIPRVPARERTEIEDAGDGFHLVTIRYGFMDSPDVPRELSRIRHPGLDFTEATTTYFIGHDRVLARRDVEGMAVWREKLFAAMARNSQDATAYFNLPPNRVIELGAQLEL